MSLSESEPTIANSFRELLDYVSNLGEHINQIYARLGKIEASVRNTKEDLEASITENKNALESIKETMITKSEFNDLIQKINEPFTQFTPPKAPVTSEGEPQEPY
jgi:regulator of replication initiation timing